MVVYKYYKWYYKYIMLIEREFIKLPETRKTL